MDLFTTVLEAGINVVTTADWITGHHRDRNFPLASGRRPTEVIEEACRAGGSTFYGTGMNPGLANILSVVATAGMGRVDHVTVLESVDVSCHHSVDTWKNCGYGLPVDDPRVPGMLEKGCTVFADAIYLMADCLDVTIDEVVYECELGACQQDTDLGWWQLAPDTRPSWNVKGCYVTTIKGDPTIVNRHMIFPADGATFDARTFASIGMTITGMPALNAIDAVCDAPPGLLTSADLPLRAFAGRFGAGAGAR
jgi:4-hydroxy-tetrahydrodipicolinate reductase